MVYFMLVCIIFVRYCQALCYNLGMDKEELERWGKQLEKQLAPEQRERIKQAVDLVFRDYGEVLRRLGKQ